MTGKVKILIVEDNVIIADDMQEMLEDIGYEVVDNVISYEAAIEALASNQVDLALLDVMLATEKTGIDVGRYIRSNYDIPFIFVTSNSDKATVEKAKLVSPNNYVVKPFEQGDLFTAIEITLSNFTPSAAKEEEGEETSTSSLLNDSIFIKKQNLFHRVYFTDIQFIKADNVYLEINTVDKKFLVRSSLKDYISKLPDNKFFRVHKSYIINIDHIQALNSKDVVIKDELIPISKEFRDFILSSLNQ
ncbi:LytR/AlgR family response regulator transcription factor [Sungkyunkwania multivorans]|uniref:LytR/AlgR family response regulator transcription factor n=1 Tax=Sungkyunkwania multivorans TaxID=1173618 RepID=A0ABW3CY76_9FLAO